MKLIMKTAFDNLRNNPLHQYQSDTNGEKQVVKVYFGESLIAKMIKLKKSVRYFGVKGYEQYLIEEA
ncbi:hypothetical protein H4J75_10680 [Colwellia sp. BRX10-1]|nr:hypothetical protein [Colwellia sp. BRX8-7]MBA6348911.1 hypothetical protein [Colwellia sp. BRX8-9]MBA6352221.1 hypothetical protein [Colwellia sp. BRX9-1]MBA6363505.1 hypothetical protein [Colwellia sp. BRX8-8]MBA6373446.1 hypothetical protein [Colwellia sp. BRX8-4]MBA6379640.1 hypothetical protein [Colwellia sp. BRX10-7]MBA6386237.1 hypothetical protein [Colwellia sp. BRX10-2]MBA6403401.1 hypothetical protein [Colwellia sp. BRX10-5]MBA6405964.1 hypothetical protein [Colwellia sp. BRX10